MLNGIIYIGLGNANAFHPNTLIPVCINLAKSKIP